MKKVIITLTVLIILALFAGVHIHSRLAATQYAIKYAQVFGSYDIKQVDQYLNEDTQITYNGDTDTYKNLRKNIIAAFEEKEYEMAEGSSYGYGNGTFPSKIQNIGIQTYVASDKYSSEFVSMDIKRRWLFLYDVTSISSDNNFFGYLFFGIEK